MIDMLNMFYPKSVWRAERGIYGHSGAIANGTEFTVVDVGEKITWINVGDREIRIATKSGLRHCSLVSSEKCDPVYFLRRGKQYYVKGHERSGFGPRMLGDDLQFISSIEVLKVLAGIISESSSVYFSGFSYEKYNPSTNMTEVFKIDPVWCENIRFIQQKFGRITDRMLALVPDRIINALAIFPYGYESDFVEDIASVDMGFLYVIDNPEDIPLLKLHYGDDITIFENDYALS